MSNSNNSGGTTPINPGTGTGSNTKSVTITGAGGGGGGGNVVFIPTQNPQWITVSIPTGTSQQYTIQGIDWAVPVEEKENKSDGCSCKKCKEYFEYAEPNQEDGTLICWACRHGY